MSFITCVNKASLGEEELDILDTHVQAFRKEGKSKAVAERLAVTARLGEINQDLQDVQKAIDKAPKPKEKPIRPSVSVSKPITKATIEIASLKETDGYKERRAKVVEGITKLFNEMAPGVAVKVSDKVFAEGEGLRLSGAKTTEKQEVGGTFDPVKTLADISLNKGDPTSNTQHEALHALKEAGLFTKAEWKLLESQSEKNWKKEYAVPDTEEGIAYAFGDWRQGKKNFSGPVTKLFQRVKDFIERLGNMLKGSGFQTVDDVFEKVRTGKVGKRPAKKVAAKKITPKKVVTKPKRASITKEKEAPAYSGFNYTDEKVFDFLARKVQDKMRRLKVLQHAVEAEAGELSEASNAYLQEELYYGRVETLLSHLEDDYVKPLIESVRKGGLTLEELDDYVYALHAPERNAFIKTINPEFREKDIAGSGMTDAEAKEIVQKFAKAGKLPALKKAAQLVYAVNHARLDLLRDAGLENEEILNHWEAKYNNYVPLRGIGGKEAGPRTGKGYDVRGKESKRALGRQSRAQSPVTYAIVQMQESLIRAEKNRVGQAFLRMVSENPNPDLWQIINPMKSTKMRFNKKTGEVEYGPDPLRKLKDNVMSVKVNGREYYIEIKDQPLASAMKNLGAETGGKVIRGLAAFNRFLAMVNTSLNPEFIFSNFARDLQTAMINLVGEQDATGSLKEPKQIARKVMKDVPSALRGAFYGLRNIKADDKWTKWFEEFRAAGGKIGFFGLEDIATKEKQLMSLLVEAEGGAIASATHAVKVVGDMMMDVNGAVENAVRLSAYVHARKAGFTKARAASLARNLTVNFNRKGELGVLSNSLYLFFNAGLQGSVRLIYAARSRRVQILLGMIAAGAFLWAEMNRWIGGDDDETGENRYDQIPDYKKKRNLIFMRPDGSHYSIPLPYGYNVPYVFGETINAMVHGRNVGKSAVHIVDTVMESFNPLGTEDSDSVEKRIVKMVSPTILDPFVQLGMNEDYAGRPIKPENYRGGDQKPDSELYWSSVSPVSKAITSQVNRLTGGSPARPGAIDISPETIDHVVGFMTGGAGRFMLNTIDMPITKLQGDEIPTYKIPFVRRFYSEPSPFYANRRYYQVTGEIDAVDYERDYVKATGDLELYEAFSRDNLDLLQMRGMLRSTNKKLRNLRRKRNIIKARTDMTKNYQRAEVKKFNERIRMLQMRVIKRYNNAINKDQKDKDTKSTKGSSKPSVTGAMQAPASK